jgi:hypothetical protein
LAISSPDLSYDGLLSRARNVATGQLNLEDALRKILEVAKELVGHPAGESGFLGLAVLHPA